MPSRYYFFCRANNTLYETGATRATQKTLKTQAPGPLEPVDPNIKTPAKMRRVYCIKNPKEVTYYLKTTKQGLSFISTIGGYDTSSKSNADLEKVSFVSLTASK